MSRSEVKGMFGCVVFIFFYFNKDVVREVKVWYDCVFIYWLRYVNVKCILLFIRLNFVWLNFWEVFFLIVLIEEMVILNKFFLFFYKIIVINFIKLLKKFLLRVIFFLNNLLFWVVENVNYIKIGVV